MICWMFHLSGRERGWSWVWAASSPLRENAISR